MIELTFWQRNYRYGKSVEIAIPVRGMLAKAASEVGVEIVDPVLAIGACGFGV